MFFVKPQRRKHCDNEIIHVILIQTAESIDSINFLARVMRRLHVCVWCDQLMNWSDWSRTLFKDRAQFSKNESIDWNLVFEQFLKCPKQFTSKIIIFACFERLLNWTWTYWLETSRLVKGLFKKCFQIHDEISLKMIHVMLSTLNQEKLQQI